MNRKTLAVVILIVFLLFINILTILICSNKTNNYEKNSIYIGKWESLGDKSDVDYILKSYEIENSMNIKYNITEEDAVSIAAIAYKSVFEDKIKDTYAEVEYYHDQDENGTLREYYLVSRYEKNNYDNSKYLLRPSIIVVINKKNGEIVAIRPQEG